MEAHKNMRFPKVTKTGSFTSFRERNNKFVKN